MTNAPCEDIGYVTVPLDAAAHHSQDFIRCRNVANVLEFIEGDDQAMAGRPPRSDRKRRQAPME